MATDDSRPAKHAEPVEEVTAHTLSTVEVRASKSMSQSAQDADGAPSVKGSEWSAKMHAARRERKEAEAQTVHGPQTEAQSQELQRVADLQTLQTIIDDKRSLASDRIRAVESKQRIMQRVQDLQAQEAYGPLVALKGALDSVPPEQRVQALHGLLGVEGAEGAHHAEVETHTPTQG